MVLLNAPGVVAFYQQRDALWVLTQLFWPAFSLILLGGGGAIWLRNHALASVKQRYYLGLSLFTGLYLLAGILVVLPLNFYRDIAHLQSWHHQTPTALNWLLGEASTAVMTVVAGIVFVVILFALMRRSPKWWWIWASLASSIVLISAIVLSQVVINPITQHWSQLKEPQLLETLNGFEKRCGLDNVLIYVGGNDTSVVGLGPTKRIVIAADDFAKLPRPQLIVALAHELKHYRMGDDDWIGISVVTAIIVLCFGSVAAMGSMIVRRRSDLVGSSLSDVAAVPLVFAILAGSWFFLGSPIFNIVQRHFEFDADKFALELTHDNGNLIALQWAMIKKTTGPRLVEYYPFYEYVRANHPSDADRIRFALSYQPWREGKPETFSNVCKQAPRPRLADIREFSLLIRHGEYH